MLRKKRQGRKRDPGNFQRYKVVARRVIQNLLFKLRTLASRLVTRHFPLKVSRRTRKRERERCRFHNDNSSDGLKAAASAFNYHVVN